MYSFPFRVNKSICFGLTLCSGNSNIIFVEKCKSKTFGFQKCLKETMFTMKALSRSHQLKFTLIYTMMGNTGVLLSFRIWGDYG